MRRLYRLNAMAVARAKQPGLYADGAGLYLQVTPTGTKSWLFRYAVDGRERAMGLGPLHTINLKEARERARVCRQQRLDGIDPLEARRQVRQTGRLEAARAMTFRECAEAFFEAKSDEWTSPKHRQEWAASLERYVHPLLGDLPVSTIDTDLVVKVLEPHWRDKRESVRRVRGRIESVLDWATVRKFRSGDNPARWKGHLEHVFAGKGEVEHHPALPYAELPDFMARLRTLDGVPARALEFCILTAARSGEVFGATWSEIDFEGRTWTVPADRMKAGREHRVPLSASACVVLQAMWERRESGYVFPGRGVGKSLGPVALQQVLRGRLGVTGCTVHGFRSCFSDWCTERTNFPVEAREMALAHSVGTKVEEAYRRTDLFERRRQLADAWAAFCSGEDDAEVVPLRRQQAGT